MGIRNNILYNESEIAVSKTASLLLTSSGDSATSRKRSESHKSHGSECAPRSPSHASCPPFHPHSHTPRNAIDHAACSQPHINSTPPQLNTQPNSHAHPPAPPRPTTCDADDTPSRQPAPSSHLSSPTLRPHPPAAQTRPASPPSC